MKRIAAAFALTGMLIAVAASAAVAKVPPFSVTISTEAPAPDESVTVEVMLEQALPVEDLNGLLGVFPVGALQDNERPASTADFLSVDLSRTTDRTYRGRFRAPATPGEYVLVSFPNTHRPSPAADLYPDPMPFAVEVGAATDAPMSPRAAGILGGIVLVLAGAAAWRHRSVRKRQGATPTTS